MPTYPDRDTLRLRAPDGRSLAEAAALARRELAPRPPDRDLAPGRGERGVSRQARRVGSFTERYGAVAERFHPGVLWAAAHLAASPPGRLARCPDGWCLARAYAKR